MFDFNPIVAAGSAPTIGEPSRRSQITLLETLDSEVSSLNYWLREHARRGRLRIGAISVLVNTEQGRVCKPPGSPRCSSQPW